MESIADNLEEGETCRSVETSRRCMYPKRRKVQINRSIQDNIVTKYRRENILQHSVEAPNFLIMNQYIDTSVQKGGVAGIPGCIEHTGVVSQLICEARENNRNLAVLWLDLANAYGSIPHKVVEETLRRYHVPSSFSNLILDYYNNFNLRVTSGTKTSDWHRLERGIITGCTISATLFSLAMNMIIKSAEVECRGPRVKSGIRQPPLRAYMDDITVTTSSVIG